MLRTLVWYSNDAQDTSWHVQETSSYVLNAKSSLVMKCDKIVANFFKDSAFLLKKLSDLWAIIRRARYCHREIFKLRGEWFT